MGIIGCEEASMTTLEEIEKLLPSMTRAGKAQLLKKQARLVKELQMRRFLPMQGLITKQFLPTIESILSICILYNPTMQRSSHVRKISILLALLIESTQPLKHNQSCPTGSFRSIDRRNNLHQPLTTNPQSPLSHYHCLCQHCRVRQRQMQSLNPK